MNNDDDDEIETADNAETGPITGQDDLVKIILRRVLPPTGGQTVTLKKTHPGSRIKVWTSPTKGEGNELTLPEDFDVSSGHWPRELWVEGYAVSGAERDVELKLERTEGGTTCEDKVKVTVVAVDLDIDGVTDAEEETIGAYICLNDDDDDGDGVVDYEDGYNKDGIPGNDDDTNPDEDDLVAITLHQALPARITGEVTLSAPSGGARIKLWESPTKGTEVSLPAEYQTPAELPETLYVEGVGAGRSVLLVALFLVHQRIGPSHQFVQ